MLAQDLMKRLILETFKNINTDNGLTYKKIGYWKKNRKGKRFRKEVFVSVFHNTVKSLDNLPSDPNKLTKRHVDIINRIVRQILEKENLRSGDIIQIGKVLVKIPEKLFTEVDKEEEIEILSEAITTKDDKQLIEASGIATTPISRVSLKKTFPLEEHIVH